MIGEGLSRWRCHTVHHLYTRSYGALNIEAVIALLHMSKKRAQYLRRGRSATTSLLPTSSFQRLPFNSLYLCHWKSLPKDCDTACTCMNLMEIPCPTAFCWMVPGDPAPLNTCEYACAVKLSPVARDRNNCRMSNCTRDDMWVDWWLWLPVVKRWLFPRLRAQKVVDAASRSPHPPIWDARGFGKSERQSVLLSRCLLCFQPKESTVEFDSYKGQGGHWNVS